jgi:hypothetical protein
VSLDIDAIRAELATACQTSGWQVYATTTARFSLPAIVVGVPGNPEPITFPNTAIAYLPVEIYVLSRSGDTRDADVVKVAVDLALSLADYEGTAFTSCKIDGVLGALEVTVADLTAADALAGWDSPGWINLDGATAEWVPVDTSGWDSDDWATFKANRP